MPLPVSVVLGPEVADHSAVGRARERAQHLFEFRHAGMFPLLSVEAVDGRTGWVYPAVDGVSLSVAASLCAGDLGGAGWVSRAAMAGGGLPLRAAAEIVAQCALQLEGLVPLGIIHPGMGSDDVLLDATGSIAIANFVGPFAQAPSHRDPRGLDDGFAVVWRLGMLFAEILTGAPPGNGGERGAHELAVRRVLVRIMSRPGPMVPERFRDWVIGMLAWDSDARPPLSRVAPGLLELAASLPGPDLATLASQVEGFRARAEAGEPLPDHPRPATLSGPIDLTTEVTVGDRTEEVGTDELALADHFAEDEVTAVSDDADVVRVGAAVGTPLEHGTIPVKVGPPPEVVARRGRLPRDLFGGPRPDNGAAVPAAAGRRWGVLVAFSLLLALAAAALAVYLL